MRRCANRRQAVVASVQVGDGDAPDFFDMTIAADRIARRMSGEPDLAALRQKYGLTSEEVVRMLAPRAHRDPATGVVALNAGYDPDHAEGRIERLIWRLVEREAASLIAAGDSHRPRDAGPTS